MPTEPDYADVKNGPLAKAGPMLIQLFLEHRAHRQQRPSAPFASDLSGMLRIEGECVGVQARASADPGPAVSFLRGLGLKEEVIEPRFGIVEGLLPIDRLPEAAASGLIVGLAPILRPAHR